MPNNHSPGHMLATKPKATSKTTRTVQTMLRTIGKPTTTPVTIGGRQPKRGK